MSYCYPCSESKGADKLSAPLVSHMQSVVFYDAAYFSFSRSENLCFNLHVIYLYFSDMEIV